MKKQMLVILAVIMAVALVSVAGQLVIPEQEDTQALHIHSSHIAAIIMETTSYLGRPLERPMYDVNFMRLQQCLTALHGKCEDLAMEYGFHYPADTSFRHLADGIDRGAYSQEELQQMETDFEDILAQLSNAAGPDPLSREFMPYDEMSRLLTDFLKKWVRSA